MLANVYITSITMPFLAGEISSVCKKKKKEKPAMNNFEIHNMLSTSKQTSHRIPLFLKDVTLFQTFTLLTRSRKSV